MHPECQQGCHCSQSAMRGVQHSQGPTAGGLHCPPQAAPSVCFLSRSQQCSRLSPGSSGVPKTLRRAGTAPGLATCKASALSAILPRTLSLVDPPGHAHDFCLSLNPPCPSVAHTPVSRLVWVQYPPLPRPRAATQASAQAGLRPHACLLQLGQGWASRSPSAPYLVGGDVCVRREGQHAHHLSDLVQLTPLSLAEVFPRVSGE